MSSKSILIHGGGPTSVLNASLGGAVLAARRTAGFPSLLGARFGMAGVLKREFIDLSAQPEELVRAIADTPGSALGSTRFKLTDAHFEQAVEILLSLDVRIALLNGGNGTMRTALRLSRAAQGRIQVIGIPKTIDNDIPGTDHTPGYGSCVRYFAHAVRDAGQDNRGLPSPVMIVETLGRDTGWVTAGTALARVAPDDPPNLIYLPEHRVSLERICTDVERTVKNWGRCVIALCEGQLDPNGQAFGADLLQDRTGSQQSLAANLGHTLAQLIQAQTGMRTRSEKPGLAGRSNGLAVSERDRQDAWACGEAAVQYAAQGQSGVMASLRHDGATEPVSLETVTNGIRPFPVEWIRTEEAYVAPEFLEWLKPLVGGVNPYPRFQY